MRLSGIYCMDGQRVGRHRVLSDVRGLTCMLCGLFRGGVRRKRKGGGGGGGGGGESGGGGGIKWE